MFIGSWFGWTSLVSGVLFFALILLLLHTHLLFFFCLLSFGLDLAS